MTSTFHDSTVRPSAPFGPAAALLTAVAARGGSFGARLGKRLSAAALWLWKALEADGQRRASRELMLSAHHWDATDPEMAARMRAAARFDDSARSR